MAKAWTGSEEVEVGAEEADEMTVFGLLKSSKCDFEVGTYAASGSIAL